MPDPLLEPAEDPRRRLEAGEAREDAARREPLEAHPRTAPAVSPNAIRFWTKRKKITTGIAVSVAPAIRPPQSVPRLVPRNPASQIVSVCFCWSESRM